MRLLGPSAVGLLDSFIASSTLYAQYSVWIIYRAWAIKEVHPRSNGYVKQKQYYCKQNDCIPLRPWHHDFNSLPCRSCATKRVYPHHRLAPSHQLARPIQSESIGGTIGAGGSWLRLGEGNRWGRYREGRPFQIVSSRLFT